MTYYDDEISGEEIQEIAELHFVRGVPTDELMRQARNARRKSHVAAVALYSIERTLLLGLLAGEAPEVKASILRCHEKITALLAKWGR